MKFKGIVKKNLGRGTEMGFPTANIPAPEELEDGLYLAFVTPHSSPPHKGEGTESSKKPALVFIGAPETFNETQRRAEAYLLDFSGDLYDQEIEIEIIKKLRENIKFESQEALIEQMKQDEVEAREFFKNVI